MNQRIRGFEIVSAYQDQAIQLPQRSTYKAAGYDIEAAETITLPSYWKQVVTKLVKGSVNQADKDLMKPTLVPTGLKAYMQADEYLQIINRSSNPLKRFIALPNSVGIIDQDYYNNPANEGHIYVQLQNFGLFDVTIEKGDRIAQGIFAKYYTVDGDQGGLEQRSGGFGSSGK